MSLLNELGKNLNPGEEIKSEYTLTQILEYFSETEDYYEAEEGVFGYCAHCYDKAQAVEIDQSFDHCFGTEHASTVASRCCEANVIPEYIIEDALLGADDEDIKEYYSK